METTILYQQEEKKPPKLKPEGPPTMLDGSESIDTAVEAFNETAAGQKGIKARALAAELLRKHKAEAEEAKELKKQEAIAAGVITEVNLIDEEYERQERERKAVLMKDINTKVMLENRAMAEEAKELPSTISKIGKPTTPAGVQKLMNALNINLDVQLTRTDTKNLLATLLTCNESQLRALQNNAKVPIAIKIVIKRLLDDANVGSMEALNDLWDRVFGKGGLAVETPTGPGVLPGVIPGQPVSREAYVLIRETIFGGK